MSIVDPVGQLFLWLDRRNQPMHVGGLQIFRLPDNADDDYLLDLVEQLRTQDKPVRSPFNQTITYHLGQPFWQTVHDFRVADHVQHLILPKPGGTAALNDLIAQLHAQRLTKQRPLWQLYVIEGVDRQHFAFYLKFHHCIMDGISAMRLLQNYLQPQPSATERRAPWLQGSDQPARSTPPPTGLASLGHWLQGGYQQLKALPDTARHLYGIWRDALVEPGFAGPAQAPACLTNRAISAQRSFVTRRISLARIRALGQRFDATINDIVLAACSAALRSYLLDMQALPEAPLIALVPVSLHTAEGTNGNHLALLYANLATHVADPAIRLNVIKRSVDYWKQRFQGMSAEQIMATVAFLTAPTGVKLLTGASARKQAFNVVVSNIPGPDNSLYHGQAELTGMYPVTLVLDGQALNISLISYQDHLEFGVLACPQAVPELPVLLDYLEQGIEALEQSQPVAEAGS